MKRPDLRSYPLGLEPSHSSPSSLYNRIYVLVCQVPSGRVTTYGSIGRYVGCTARTVGFAMAALPPRHNVPWQRVINGQGKVSQRREGDGTFIQRMMLEDEGVHFDFQGRVDLTRYAWEPSTDLCEATNLQKVDSSGAGCLPLTAPSACCDELHARSGGRS